jgi:uncharacterized membrane protein
VGSGVESKRRLRTGVGRLEIVEEADHEPLLRLRANLGDAACRLLAVCLLLAQALDALTTTIALQRSSFYESNVLARSLAASPLTGLAVKLCAAFIVLALVLLRLPTRQARMAVRLALVLSMLAPIANLVTLTTH